MTLKQYLSAIGSAAAVAWAVALAIVLSVDPFTAPPAVLGGFYLILLLALTGTFSLIGFTVRLKVIKKDEVLSRQVFAAFRQALFLSIALVILLFLRSHGPLGWRAFALTAIILTATEFVVLSLSHRR